MGQDWLEETEEVEALGSAHLMSDGGQHVILSLMVNEVSSRSPSESLQVARVEVQLFPVSAEKDQ